MLKLRHRFLGVLWGVVVPAIGVVSFFGSHFLSSRLAREDMVHDVAVSRIFLKVSSDALREGRTAAVSDFLETLLAFPDLEEARLLGPDGRTVAAQGPAAGERFEPDPAAWARALSSFTPVVKEETRGGRSFDVVYQRVWAEQPQITTLGVCYMRFSNARIENVVSRTVMLFAAVGLLLAAGTSVVGFHLMSGHIRTIEALCAAVRDAGGGRFDRRVAVLSSDELGELSRGFNAMLVRLQETTISKEYFHGLVNTIPLAVIVLDDEARVTFWNAAAEKTFGWGAADVLGAPCPTIPGDMQGEFKDIFRGLMAGRASGDLELAQSRKDGTRVVVNFSAQPLRDSQGIVDSAVILGLDLTARLESEAALRGAYSLLSATLEATADGILVVDRESRILRYNQKFAAMWRIPEEVLAARDDARALDCVLAQLKDPEAFLKRVRELYRDSSATSFDVLEFRDGRVFERYSQPQVVNGVCVGRVWDFRDVSERSRLEAMLAQSEKLSAVGQLAAGVAHEINNPLGVILGFAQAAARRLAPGDVLELPIRSIEREAQRCASLVKSLLTFSRQTRPQVEELDLNETAASTLTLVETRAKVRGVAVVREFAAKGRVRGDRIQLQQVVLNLCNNAVDAVREGEGGVIVLRTRDEAGAAGPTVVLEVEDNGAGIPEDVMGKIYNPFFTTKEVGQGTGLGLSLVHEIVKRHRGDISVRSLVGSGTTFSVRLPAEG
ncbi:MAG: PAS sensor protein [Elusimicrobia bacterium]|nr:MAG: PAS sensor protein [Elusimicrobiota bacterium]